MQYTNIPSVIYTKYGLQSPHCSECVLLYFFLRNSSFSRTSPILTLTWGNHVNVRIVFGDFQFLWGLQKWLCFCAELSSQSYRCPIAMSHTWRARSFQMHMQTSRINLSYWSRESFWLQRKENKLQPSEHYHANWFQFRLTAVVFYHIQVW